MTFVRSLDAEQTTLREIVGAVLGPAGNGWALIFTHTQGALLPLIDLDRSTLDRSIWAHLFTPETEVRWREDDRRKLILAIGSDISNWPDSPRPDRRLNAGEELDLPLIGHFDGTGWTQANLRPDALDYRVTSLGGRSPQRHDQLAVKATPLFDPTGQLAYNWHRNLSFWEAQQ